MVSSLFEARHRHNSAITKGISVTCSITLSSKISLQDSSSNGMHLSRSQNTTFLLTGNLSRFTQPPLTFRPQPIFALKFHSNSYRFPYESSELNVRTQLEGLILKDVLLRGVRAGILSLPIHDAVAVEFDNQDWAKDAMEDSWQSVISEFHKTAKPKSSIKIQD